MSQLLLGSVAHAGALDESFANPEVTHLPDGNDAQVTDLIVQPDGKILIGGIFDHVAGVAQPQIARLNVDGTLDRSFVSPFDDFSNVGVALALAADGSVFVGGAFRIGGGATKTVVKLTSTGAVAASFKLDQELALQEPSWLTARGSDLYVGTLTRVVRVTATAALDPSFTIFSPNWIAASMRAVVQSTGGLVAVGTSEGAVEPTITWRSSSGGPGAIADFVVPRVGELFLQSNGDLIVAGRYEVASGHRNFFRVKANGTLDETYSGLETASFVPRVGIGLQADDKLLVEGQNRDVGGDDEIRRLDAAGAYDDFRVTVNELVETSAPYPGKRMMVGGRFTAIDGTARLCVARLFGNDSPSNGAGGAGGMGNEGGADGDSAAGAPTMSAAAGMSSTGSAGETGAGLGGGGENADGSDAAAGAPAGGAPVGSEPVKHSSSGCDCAISPASSGVPASLLVALAFTVAKLRSRRAVRNRRVG